MCVIVAKYFPDLGWVAVKNRDRNYVPEISFKKTHHKGIEILYFIDDITQYCEGLNSAGVCILSASLMVIDDEKEITQRGKTHSKDGARIKKALEYSDPKAAAMFLINEHLTGNTVVFNTETMILIESAWENNAKDKFGYKAKVIPHNQVIARSNHGIWLPWAGYQRDVDQNQTLSRISSESRQKIADYIVHESDSPDVLIDNLAKDYVDHPQLNVLRTTKDKKKMRTTAQIMLSPKEQTMFVRPVQSHMVFDFWELNDPEQKTWFELLSNRVMHRGKKAKLTQPTLVHQVSHED